MDEIFQRSFLVELKCETIVGLREGNVPETLFKLVRERVPETTQHTYSSFFRQESKIVMRWSTKPWKLTCSDCSVLISWYVTLSSIKPNYTIYYCLHVIQLTDCTKEHSTLVVNIADSQLNYVIEFFKRKVKRLNICGLKGFNVHLKLKHLVELLNKLVIWFRCEAQIHYLRKKNTQSFVYFEVWISWLCSAIEA